MLTTSHRNMAMLERVERWTMRREEIAQKPMSSSHRKMAYQGNFHTLKDGVAEDCSQAASEDGIAEDGSQVTATTLVSKEEYIIHGDAPKLQSPPSPPLKSPPSAPRLLQSPTSPIPHLQSPPSTRPPTLPLEYPLSRTPPPLPLQSSPSPIPPPLPLHSPPSCIVVYVVTIGNRIGKYKAPCNRTELYGLLREGYLGLHTLSLKCSVHFLKMRI